MTNSYAKAYTEVLEILSHFSEEEYYKIPQEKINFYKSNMEKNYEYSIDPNIDLSKQHISKEANAILISIFRDYFANDRQRQILNNLLSQNQEKHEKIKKEKYNPDNIFINNNRNVTIDNTKNKQELALVEINYMKWYTKVWRLIKDFFRK